MLSSQKSEEEIALFFRSVSAKRSAVWLIALALGRVDNDMSSCNSWLCKWEMLYILSSSRVSDIVVLAGENFSYRTNWMLKGNSRTATDRLPNQEILTMAKGNHWLQLLPLHIFRTADQRMPRNSTSKRSQLSLDPITSVARRQGSCLSIPSI